MNKDWINTLHGVKSFKVEKTGSTKHDKVKFIMWMDRPMYDSEVLAMQERLGYPVKEHGKPKNIKRGVKTTIPNLDEFTTGYVNIWECNCK